MCVHVQAIQGCDAVVYGMGSLYTSICPTLILEGVGEAIAARDVHKVSVGEGGRGPLTHIEASVYTQCGLWCIQQAAAKGLCQHTHAMTPLQRRCGTCRLSRYFAVYLLHWHGKSA